jgi:hypothetical protein
MPEMRQASADNRQEGLRMQVLRAILWTQKDERPLFLQFARGSSAISVPASIRIGIAVVWGYRVIISMIPEHLWADADVKDATSLFQ